MLEHLPCILSQLSPKWARRKVVIASIQGGHEKSRAESIDSVFAPQGEALGGLYDNAAGLWNNRDNSGIYDSGQFGTDYANNIAQGSMGGWNQQMGGGIQASPALMQSLQESMSGPSSMGQMYNSIIGGAGNEYIDPMVDSLKAGMKQDYLWGTQPNQDMAAEYAGQGGSSRHGVNQFLAKNQLGENMARGEAELRGANWDKDMAMKMFIAQQADTNRGSAQDRAISLLNSQNANQQGALGMGQGMQDVGAGGFDLQQAMGNIDWNQLMQYANTIGAPTVLNAASGSGNSRNAQVGVGK